MINNVAEKLKDALDVDIDQILLSAWSQHKGLIDDLDKSRQARDETILVPLADHTIRSTHHPAVEVLIHDRRVAAFKFNANLVMRIQGVVLRLQAGKVVGIESGTWQGVGQLKCGPVTLVEHETKEFRLPATFGQARPKSKVKPPPKPKAGTEGRAGFHTPHWRRPA